MTSPSQIVLLRPFKLMTWRRCIEGRVWTALLMQLMVYVSGEGDCTAEAQKVEFCAIFKRFLKTLLDVYLKFFYPSYCENTRLAAAAGGPVGGLNCRYNTTLPPTPNSIPLKQPPGETCIGKLLKNVSWNFMAKNNTTVNITINLIFFSKQSNEWA